MTIHAVDEHHYTHTCPSNPTRHVVRTTRTVVQTTPGRPCTRPLTVHCGATSVLVPCGQRVPADHQCGGCRTVVTIHAIVTTHLGHHGPDEVPA